METGDWLAEPQTETKHRFRILIIDDDEDLAMAVSLKLQSLGYDVECANSGTDGLAKAQERIPDLILLDIMMPDITGWTLMVGLRGVRELLFVPVLFMSSLSDPHFKAAAFALGADGYLTKPLDLDLLTNQVRRLIEQRAIVQPKIEAQLKDTEQAPAFHGSTTDISLSAVLLMLEVEKKSGVLELSYSDNEAEAIVTVYRGKVHSARLSEGTSYNTRFNGNAIGALLERSGGQFIFHPKSEEPEDEIDKSTTQLLIGIAQEIDEVSGGWICTE